VVLADQEPEDKLTPALERVLQAVALPVQLEGREIEVSCSIGVSLYPRDGQDADMLLKNADVAMYRAKELGRNNFQFYEKQLNVRINERLELQRSLRRAIENGEIFLHYQPQFSLRTGAAVAVEALARWTSPMLGSVPPDRFIPVAEDCGLIVPLGQCILRRASVQMKAWLDAGMSLERIAVNLSARQLGDTEFLPRVERILADTGLLPQRLEFELTESVLMQQGEEAASVFRALQAMGVTISIDDFGTGYSSLSYLRRYPVNRLKVDRSFVRDIATDARDAAITKGIIALAHSVGLGVVAEGVENAQQLALLRESGCEEAQGYYLGYPGPASAICAQFEQQPCDGELRKIREF
jgi:EAL domain-containing protein (putative c-di-GMP-specific phosphodiesterase class I)